MEAALLVAMDGVRHQRRSVQAMVPLAVEGVAPWYVVDRESPVRFHAPLPLQLRCKYACPVQSATPAPIPLALSNNFPKKA